MITPDMTFAKSVQLSITELNEAKEFAEDVHKKILKSQASIDPTLKLELKSEICENGSYIYTFQNDLFTGKANLVFGWDMQHVNGESKKFMALNFNNKFGSREFLNSIENIEKLPYKYYLGGMFFGALIGFAACMRYAYYTEKLDVFFFFIVILVGGWLSSKIGSVIGENAYNMAYDNLEEKVMTEAEYISISEGVLAFNESISSIFEDVLVKDKLQAAS